MYFLRFTRNASEDLQRGWSCHNHGWARTEQAANEFARKYRTRGVKFDPVNKIYCAMPEDDLSSFAFHDEATYQQAKNNVSGYGSTSVGLFSSNNYSLGAGEDGEDVFRDGQFHGYVDLRLSYEKLMQQLGQLPIQTQEKFPPFDLNARDMFIEDDPLR
jgi:hypothetical protein